MVKILVCRVGQDPKIEEVDQPFYFAQRSVLEGAYIEAKIITVNDGTRVVVYWDEDSRAKKLPFNRNVPARALPPAVKPGFVIDMRKDPPHYYAREGEMGFFPVLGNFIVTKADEEGDHISLTDAEISTLVPLLTLPKCVWCGELVSSRQVKYCSSACAGEDAVHSV